MKLSTEVFNSLDRYIEETAQLSILAGCGGRFGLIPNGRRFELTVNITNGILEVVSLNCQGITKSGRLIDISFDSNYNSSFDSRISFPSGDPTEAFILAVKLHNQQIREVNELLCEEAYSFELLGENSPVDDDTLPVGLIVNQYGWRLDESDFLPPCLDVGSHPRYQDALLRAKALFQSISERCLNSDNYVARHALSSTWNAAYGEYTRLDKERAAMTPEALLGCIQRVVGSFIIGCAVDRMVNLEDKEPFIAYMRRPYNARSLYRDIMDGIELCSEISLKIDKVCDMTEIEETLIEKPKTKTAPTPPPVNPIGRRRWDGKEI